jgi:GTP-binding protein
MEIKIIKADYIASAVKSSQYPEEILPEIVFIGRSNVGKSSLINSLCNRKNLARTSQVPGKTQTINFYKVTLKILTADNLTIYPSVHLVDLPGYGYAKLPEKMRREIGAVIDDYVLNSTQMQVLFVLVDSRHDIGRIDVDFLASLGERGIPCAIIFTKADKLGPVALQTQIERDKAILSQYWEELPPMFSSSSSRGDGREQILSYIESILKRSE